MARSVWKGPYVCGSLLKAVGRARESGTSKLIKTRSRRSDILPTFIGLTYAVYNGRKFIPVSVYEHMVGHKLGEYSPTRVYYGHAGSKRANRR